MTQVEKNNPAKMSKSERRKSNIERNVAALPKGDFEAGDLLKTIAEVAAMPVGTEVQVEEVRHEGAHFSVLVLKGPRAGDEMLIAAPDLELFKSKKQQLEEKEKLERLKD